MSINIDNLQLLPVDFDANRLGCCIEAATLATRALLDHGITNFMVVEGWVDFGDGVLGEDMIEPGLSHTWIEYGGQIIDLTKGQFKKWGFDPKKIVYCKEVHRQWEPCEYLDFTT